MTTITIKNSKNFKRTHFENLADLQDYLAMEFFENEYEFSDEFKNTLDKREEEMMAANEEEITWDKVKRKVRNNDL